MFGIHDSSLIHLFFISFQPKIETSTDVLKDILKPVVDKVEGEEIPWPPRDPEVLKQMEKVSFFSFSFMKFQCKPSLLCYFKILMIYDVNFF